MNLERERKDPFDFRYMTIFDVEFTSWEGALERWWSRENEAPEIVQIGAVIVDMEDGYREIDQFECLIKPVLNPVLSDYFVDLTGISQQDVEEKGISFREGVEKFLEFSKNEGGRGDTKLASHGVDGAIIALNCNLLGIDVDPALLRAINLVPLHRRLTKCGSDRLPNSGELANLVGLEVEGRAHTALSDARSIAAFLRYHFA